MNFTKMHGCGNDYIYINCFEEAVEDPAALAVQVSDRHFGVGSDGLVLILPSSIADFKMRIFNADGSEAMMCGNALRCIAKYVWDNGMTKKNPVALETLSGVKIIHVKLEQGSVVSARVDMGAPALIPVEQTLRLDDGTVFDVTCVSMGNPHCVAFVEDTEAFPLERIGPRVERHPWFPDRINAEFVQLLCPTAIKMRVWERGSGETLACGTGACASAVACILNGRCAKDTDITVQLRGGDLVIRWDSAADTVYMTGPAAFICSGTLANA
ncbi:MAG: diaminopimelate epimerase [Oscillospiraceae bacterium]|nr:diaminopimelate epimerase [Oscillospiraceae bacterium]